MEAHRRQAYLDLIYTLLEAPESEAEEILAAKQELVDAGLLETMREVAADLTSLEALEEANRLFDIVGWQLGIYKKPLQSKKVRADALLKIGIGQERKSQFRSALDYWQRALKIYQEIGDSQGEADTLHNLGVACDSLGKPTIVFFQESLAKDRETGNRQGEAASLVSLGNAYRSLGQYQQAISCYNKSLAIAREIGNSQVKAACLGGLGNAYHSLEQYRQEIEYHKQALDIYRKIGDRLGEGNCLNNLGLYYNSIRQYQEAIRLYQQSLSIAQEIDNRQLQANALGNLGLAYHYLKRYDNATEYYKQQSTIAQEIGDVRGALSAGNNIGLISLFTNSQLPEAEAHLREAIAIAETLRSGLEDAHKISIFETQAKTYRLLQQVLIARLKDNEALVIAERGRTRAFVELLRQRLSGDGSRDEANRYISLEEIQAVAREQKATIVEYSLVDTDLLYIWVIQPTGEIDFRPSNLAETLGDQDLETLVLQARASVGVREKDSNGQPISRDPKYKIDREGRYPLLQAFYNLLIAPIRDLLPDAEAAEIILIPHYQLFLVPFAALQNPEGRYLLEDFTIRIAPSIQVLQLTRERQQRLQGLKQAALVVGDPTFDPKFSQEPYKLRQLLRAREAAENIAQLLAATPLLGERATKVAVIDAMLNARIVQVLAHGLLDDFGSGIPGTIILAPSENDDGALNAAEILPLSLGAEMVVLSACSSGRGKITGDGVIGLSRCFVLAGVPSLIVSLWDMGAPVAKHLMLEFYRNLEKGQNRATALRQAMLDAKKEYRQPSAWAAFTLIGESDSLVLETQLPQEVLPFMSIPEDATDSEVIESFFSILETAEPELFAPYRVALYELDASDSEAEANIARRIKDWCQSRSDVEKNLENEICKLGAGNKGSKPSDDVARSFNERLKENRERLASWSSGKGEKKNKS